MFVQAVADIVYLNSSWCSEYQKVRQSFAKKSGVLPQEGELRRDFAMVDEDENGVIDFDEYCIAMAASFL